MSPPAAEPAIPFGRYRLLEQLGSGGMAVVFRGLVEGPEGFKRPVVIKRILPQLADDPAFVRMLVDEARLSALLLHPGIVQVYELGEVNGEHFLAMEYVDGIDLGALLIHCSRKRRALPAALSCFIVHELANALGYAHALAGDDGRPLGIVHRDVSPSNVLVSRLGAVKLLDFGIAKATNAIRDERTRTGSLKGKLAYMSPEQANAQPVDARSDLFSLGIVLYELLTMRRLFRGDDDLHTLRLVRAAEVEPPSSFHAGLDPELDALVMRMLARDPAARYQRCEEVAAALKPLLHRHGTDAATLRAFLGSVGPIERKVKAVNVPTPSDADELGPRTRSAPHAADASGPIDAGGDATSLSPPPVASRARRLALVIGVALPGAAVAGWLALGRLGPRALSHEPPASPSLPSAEAAAPVAPAPPPVEAAAPMEPPPEPAPPPPPDGKSRPRSRHRDSATARVKKRKLLDPFR